MKHKRVRIHARDISAWGELFERFKPGIEMAIGKDLVVELTAIGARKLKHDIDIAIDFINQVESDDRKD